MAASLEHDEHGIIDAMGKNGSFVDESHIVYKLFEFHGRRYLNKDDHLKQPGVAQMVSHLLANGIPKGSIIIAPETSAEINLGQMVAELSDSTLVPTKKEDDVHTFEAGVLDLLKKGGKIIGVDDISNNLRTLKEIQAALQKLGLSLDEFRVMADRNPELSGGISDLQFMSLAAIQMEQWKETEVPTDLKDIAINTKLGNPRRWVGENISVEMFRQRKHKEDLGFFFDDGMQVQEVDTDKFIFIPRI